MSRLLLCVAVMIALSCGPAAAMQLTEEEIARLIAEQKKLVTINRDGCIVNPADDDDTILVCGESEDNRSQRLPNQNAINTDRIRRGEAISTVRAGARDNRSCGTVGFNVGCTQLPANSVGGFGRVPPPAIPLEEVLRGLPEPDQIVPEGTNHDPKKPQQ